MYVLKLCEEAKRDLRDIARRDAWDAARVSVLLQEIEGSEKMRHQLAVPDSELGRIKVSYFQHMRKKGCPFMRIKFWDPERVRGRQSFPYRLIYIFDDARETIHLAAVMKREEGKDYEFDQDLVRRLERICDQFGLKERRR